LIGVSATPRVQLGRAAGSALRGALACEIGGLWSIYTGCMSCRVQQSSMGRASDNNPIVFLISSKPANLISNFFIGLSVIRFFVKRKTWAPGL
jgi:hypothetical protein